jgi:hypothetical protein
MCIPHFHIRDCQSINGYVKLGIEGIDVKGLRPGRIVFAADHVRGRKERKAGTKVGQAVYDQRCPDVSPGPGAVWLPWFARLMPLTAARLWSGCCPVIQGVRGNIYFLISLCPIFISSSPIHIQSSSSRLWVGFLPTPPFRLPLLTKKVQGPDPKFKFRSIPYARAPRRFRRDFGKIDHVVLLQQPIQTANQAGGFLAYACHEWRWISTS